VTCHIARWFTRPQAVTHPSTNRAQRRLTTLIEANADALTTNYAATLRLKVLEKMTKLKRNRSCVIFSAYKRNLYKKILAQKACQTCKLLVKSTCASFFQKYLDRGSGYKTVLKLLMCGAIIYDNDAIK